MTEDFRVKWNGVADGVCAMVLAALPFSFLLALPPLAGVAVWFQSEPVSIANLTGAGVVALTLALRGFAEIGPERGWAPPTLVLGGLVLISLPATVLAVVPMSSLLGAPQTGQGVLSILASSVLVAGVVTVGRAARWRRLIVGTSLAAAVVLIALVLWAPSEWVPYYFNDYLAFHGLFAWAVLAAWGPRGRRWTGGALVLLVILAVLSGSRTVGLALLGGAGAALVAWLLRGRRSRQRLVGGLAPVVAALGCLVAILVIGASDLSRQSEGGAVYSLRSRANMDGVAMDEARERPLRALIGNGWGHYRLILSRHLTRGETIIHLAYDRRRDSQFHWDAGWRGDFHSHNDLVEAFTAAGPAGALAFLGLLAVAGGLSRRATAIPAAAFAVMLAILSGLWFQTPTTLGPQAIALGAMALPFRRRPAGIGRRAHGAVLVVTGALLWGGAVYGGVLTHQAKVELAGLERGESGRAACRPALPAAGQYHAAFIVDHVWNLLSDRLDEEGSDAAPIAGRLADYVCAADAMASQPSGTLVEVSALVARASLAFMDANRHIAPETARILEGWGVGLGLVLDQEPERYDLAAPYLSWLLVQGRDEDMARRAADLLRRRPSDPVAMWFSGIDRLNDPAGPSAGMRRMRAALDAGVERYMAVDPAVRDQIYRATTP